MQVNYIQHHGIKGQKWGVRRFQYQDDSLTPEGKIRYGVGDGRKRQSLKERAQRDDLAGYDAQKKLANRKAALGIAGAAGLTALGVFGADALKRQSLMGRTYEKYVGSPIVGEYSGMRQFKIDRQSINQFHNWKMTKIAAASVAVAAAVGTAAVAIYNHAKYKSKEREYYSQIGKEVLSKSQKD